MWYITSRKHFCSMIAAHENCQKFLWRHFVKNHQGKNLRYLIFSSEIIFIKSDSWPMDPWSLKQSHIGLINQSVKTLEGFVRLCSQHSSCILILMIPRHKNIFYLKILQDSPRDLLQKDYCVAMYSNNKICSWYFLA